MTLKIGDKVRITGNEKCKHFYKIGDIVEIISQPSDMYKNYHVKGAVGSHPDSQYIHPDELELYVEVEYEDQWHLNDGKVIIPDDADKLEKEGSVVAFRKRKVKPFKFGDKVFHKYTGNIVYIFVGYCESKEAFVICENDSHTKRVVLGYLKRVD